MAATLSRSARLHARLLRRLVPTLDAGDALDAARAFDELREAAARRSTSARIEFWLREGRALAMTAWSERRDARRRRPTGVTRAPWADSPMPVRPPRRPRSAAVGLERLGRALRQSARHLARTPLFTTVSVASLALGLAAAVAVFTVANTLLWQPQPHVADPDSLVRLVRGPGVGVWSYPDFEDARALTPALAGAAAFSGDTAVVAPAGGVPRRTIAAQISPGYFDLIGASLLRGRGFAPADLDTDEAAVISAGFWRRGYGSREDVVGQRVEVNGRALVIVGVAPPGLRLLEVPVEPDVWYLVPREQRENRGWGSLRVVGRLAPGADLAELRVQLVSTAERLLDARPAALRDTNREGAILAFRERDARVPVADRGLILAGMGGVSLVILTILGLAASNVTSMMLTRASERRPEFAMRLALGATRGQLVASVMAESVIIAGLAGGLAFLAVAWLTDTLASGLLQPIVPAPMVFTLDARVAAFAVAVTLLTSLSFGLGPALEASKPDVLPSLKGVRPSARLRRFGARSLIVTVQVAVSLALVVMSILFLRSSRAAGRADLGFDPNGVAVVPIDLTERQYSVEAAAAFFSQAGERLAGAPGVESFSFARTLPLSGTTILHGQMEIDGSADPDGSRTAAYNIVGPGYFAIVRMPLVTGREFTEGDREGTPAVAIVNEAFAARYWPGGSALGRRVEKREVVGVVRNAAYRAPDEPPQPHLWVPVAQSKERTLVAVARVAGDPTAAAREMARVVMELEPALLVEGTTMREITSAATLAQQVLSMALGAAGLAALALAVMGVYGVMAYVVSLRTREMGIRVALGASPAALAGMVVREGLGLVAVGLTAGVAIAAAAALAASAVLVGVSPLDPVSLGTGAGLLGLAAAAASYLPARRAARVDPVVSLRAE